MSYRMKVTKLVSSIGLMEPEYGAVLELPPNWIYLVCCGCCFRIRPWKQRIQCEITMILMGRISDLDVMKNHKQIILVSCHVGIVN